MRLLLLAPVVALLLVTCAPLPAPRSWPTPAASALPASNRRLDPSLPGWLPANRARLDALLAARGRASSTYD
ncbi:MAG TPA: hypothetical protein VIF09_04815, partial [Polyangiaceae bacterium]